MSDFTPPPTLQSQHDVDLAHVNERVTFLADKIATIERHLSWLITAVIILAIGCFIYFVLTGLVNHYGR